jgi:hypothetical protein
MGACAPANAHQHARRGEPGFENRAMMAANIEAEKRGWDGMMHSYAPWPYAYE